MPVMEGEHDHEGKRDGRDKGEGDEAVEERQVRAGCGRVLRRVQIGFGANWITHI